MPGSFVALVPAANGGLRGVNSAFSSWAGDSFANFGPVGEEGVEAPPTGYEGRTEGEFDIKEEGVGVLRRRQKGNNNPSKRSSPEGSTGCEVKGKRKQSQVKFPPGKVVVKE